MKSQSSTIADIETTLESIWKSFQSKNKMRASLFNLVIFTEQNKRSLYLDKIAHKVIEKFPSRILFIQIGEGSKIETTVSLVSADKDNGDIVCDLIDIKTPKKLAHKVPFIVLAHLLPDLPIYFLSGTNIDTTDTIFSRLEPLAQKIILDSEASTSITEFAQATLDYHTKKRAAVADLNWERIGTFRSLLATTFKSQEDLTLLEKTHSVEIEYNSQGNTYFQHNHIQACYFQAWLSYCMGWKIEGIKKTGPTLSFSYKGKKGPVTITLKPCKRSEVLPGRICKLHILTEEADFKIERSEKVDNCLTLEKSLKTLCFLPSSFMIDKESSGQSLINEIGHVGTSSHYIGTLNQLVSYLPWNAEL